MDYNVEWFYLWFIAGFTLWAVEEGTIHKKVLEGNDTLVPNDRLGIKMMMIIKAYHNKKCPKVPSK